MSLIGALTTTFSPPAPDCFSTLIIEDPSNTWFQLGYPGSWEENDACLPADWPRGPQFYYSPGVCPSGFQAGCHSTLDNRPGTRATCCPESYTCHPSVAINDTNFCGSLFTSRTRGTWPFLSYAQGADTPSKTTTTTTNDFGETIAASGIIIERQEGDPAWTTAEATSSKNQGGGGGSNSNNGSGGGGGSTNPTSATSDNNNTSSSSSSSPALSGGAIAGIVIGVVALLLLILGSAFLIARRRRRAAKPAAELPGGGGEHGPPQPVYELPVEVEREETTTTTTMKNAAELDEEGNRVHEFPAEVKRAELEGQGGRIAEELDGSPIEGYGDDGGVKKGGGWF